jgi:hypothetical protein
MTRSFLDDSGRSWIATAHEEQTPRHHTRWFLGFREADDTGRFHAMPEVRWQTLQTAERTIAAMSEFELKKRLAAALHRAGFPGVGAA